MDMRIQNKVPFPFHCIDAIIWYLWSGLHIREFWQLLLDPLRADSTTLAVTHSLIKVRVVCHVWIGKSGSICGSILIFLILRAPFFLAWSAWFSNVLASEKFENRTKMKGCFLLSWPHISIRLLLGRLSPLSWKAERTLLKRFWAWTFGSVWVVA